LLIFPKEPVTMIFIVANAYGKLDLQLQK
jgi:hypothetical protein